MPAPASEAPDEPAGSKPHWALVHAALISVQLIFGIGAVIGKLGVARFNPILFVGIRDGVGGPLLTLSAVLFYCIVGGPSPVPKRADLPRFAIAGFCLYCSQAFFIVGEKLSSAVIGSAWQPAQPIMTTIIAVSLGWEPLTTFKTIGISFAFVGAAFMVFYQPHASSGATDGSGSSNSSDNTTSTASTVIGNSMFFINCMGTSL
jgi:drug/metabolite transporter (DMT)-like permease